MGLLAGGFPGSGHAEPITAALLFMLKGASPDSQYDPWPPQGSRKAGVVFCSNAAWLTQVHGSAHSACRVGHGRSATVSGAGAIWLDYDRP